MDFRLFMPPQVGLDFTKAREALANGLSDNAAAARFSTERGAEIALVHALDTIDGAVPALTSEQQEYVKRERRASMSTVWTMMRLLNWLVGWCRGMWAWACVQRMLWRTLGVLVLAIVCAWFWPAGAGENRIRYAGTALQILGIGTVWWGFEKTRKLFGFEYTVVAFWRWLRGCPWWRAQSNTVTVPLTGISGFGMSAGSLSARVATADTSLAARLAILEQNVSLMDSQHSAAISTLEAKLQDVKSAHGRTSEHHRLRIERVDRKLLIAQTGGLDLSLGGLVWLAFGVVATSIPGEIVCWLGLA